MDTSNGKTNILIISPFARPNLGGVESHIDKLVAYCVKKNLYPIVLTYQPLTRNIKGDKFEKYENYEFHRINWPGYDLFNKLEKYFVLQFLYLFPGLFYLSFFYYLKNYKKISCIHAHGLIGAAITRVLTIIHPVRSVVSTHAVYCFSERPLLSYLVKSILNGFDVILAVSEVSKTEIINIGVSPEKVKVHPNWIDTDTFKIIETEAPSNNSINVLFVGRLIEKKGIYVFLETAKLFTDVIFHVVGGGSDEKQIMQTYSGLTNVKFYGILSQDNREELNKLVSLYNMCDFMISPYLYDEGFSTTLLESISCGTPLIVTERGSPPTFLNKDVAFYLPYNPTPESISKIIQEYKVKISNESYKKELQTKCRDYAQKMFGFSNADVIINSYVQP